MRSGIAVLDIPCMPFMLSGEGRGTCKRTCGNPPCMHATARCMHMHAISDFIPGGLPGAAGRS